MNIAGIIQKRTLLVAVIAVLLCLPFQAVYADDPDHCGAAGVGEAAAQAYIPELPTPYTLEQPFGGRASVTTVGEYIQLVYSYAAGIIGIIAVVLIMAGGLMWIAAAGNEQTISTAKEIIVSALTAVIIIVLSYAILRIINPTLVTQKFVVPKIPIKGCVVPDGEVVSIPAHSNLTGSGSLCPGAAAALTQIADSLAVGCPTCKIGIGSTYRSSESQEPLYACYQAAVEAGYFAKDGKTKTTAGCPADSGCGSCNLAAKPCCSNHRQGTAADLWFEFEGGDDVTFAKTSAEKLAQEFNGGGGNAALKANQDTLKLWMETPIGGKQLFKGISSEWWHFDYQGDCGTAGLCTASGAVDGYATPANNTYCKSTTKDPSGNYIYSLATCSAGDAKCITGGGYTYTEVSDGACGKTVSTGSTSTTTFYSFDGQTTIPAPSHSYYAPPTCKSTSISTGGTCPFVAVQTSSGEYALDNNILPQSEDHPGNEVITDIYKINHTPIIDEQGLYNLQIKEWENEKSYIDEVQLLKLPKVDDMEYAVTPENSIIAYTPGQETLIRCALNNGVDCINAASEKDELNVPGIPGDKLTVQFDAVKNYSNLGLLITAQGRDRVTLDIQPDGPLSLLADKLVNFIIPSANAKQSLHVYIKKQSGKWEKITELHPRELPADFELFELEKLSDLPDELEVKLVWTGYHSVDSVQMVEIQSLAEKPQIIPLNSAIHNTAGDVTAKMFTTDTQYMTLIPEEQVDLAFQDINSAIDPEKFVYFFQTTGYYYTLK